MVAEPLNRAGECSAKPASGSEREKQSVEDAGALNGGGEAHGGRVIAGLEYPTHLGGGLTADLCPADDLPRRCSRKQARCRGAPQPERTADPYHAAGARAATAIKADDLETGTCQHAVVLEIGQEGKDHRGWRIDHRVR
ncbi:MAG: hypothetical protein M3065_11725, partial [Actinomycetota bacterium]|nr:hypothetical protein [Actinomycetota bacterium]